MRNHWLQKSWKLEFTIYLYNVGISKGPYKTYFFKDLSSLRDISNLDASIELAEIVIRQLEFNNIWPSTATDRRLELTMGEKWRILSEIRAWRKASQVLQPVQ